ncbi:MAG: response regulator, partial [Planctomycetota bacterium]
AMILDVSMPGMSGDEVLTRIRRAQEHLPVVVMSGHGDHFVRDRLGGHEVAAVLRKPFRLEEIRSALAGAIEHASASTEPPPN